MKLLGKGLLHGFVKRHKDSASQVSAWIDEVEEAEWYTPNDIKVRYIHASFVSGERVVFNIKGNKYRVDTKISYQQQVVLVIRVGTHSEYDKWSF